MSDDKLEETKSYTIDHIKKVQKKMEFFARCLYDRSMNHDSSKLKSPEILGWAAMDREPKYPYGSYLYYEKMARYKETFDHHYSVNRHHPEHYTDPNHQMTIIDLLEMLCDWFSYKDNFTWEEGYDRIIEQCTRFNFSDSIQSLLLNTFKEFLVTSFSMEDDIYAEQQSRIADYILSNELKRKGILKIEGINKQEQKENQPNLDLTKLSFFNKKDLEKFCWENGLPIK